MGLTAGESKEKKTNKQFFTEEEKAGLKDLGSLVDDEIKDLKSKSGKQTKSGKQSKEAIEAEKRLKSLKISSEMLMPVARMLNNTAVNRFGESVKCTHDELQAWVDYASVVASKYTPAMLEQYGPEAALSIYTLVLIADKGMKYQAAIPKKERQEKRDQKKYRRKTEKKQNPQSNSESSEKATTKSEEST